MLASPRPLPVRLPVCRPLLAAACLFATTFAFPAAAQVPGLPDGLKLPDGLRPPAAEPAGPAAPKPVWTTKLEDRVTALAFSPDGETLAVGTFEAVELRNAEEGAAAGVLKTRSGFAEALQWLEPGVLTVGDYRRVTQWDPEAARGLEKRTGPRGYVTGLVMTDDALIAGAEDGAVRRWEGDGEPIVVQPLGEESRVPVRGIAGHGDRLAVVLGDPNRDTKGGPAFLLNAATLETLAQLPGHTRAAECATFSAGGGYVLTGGADEMARLSRLDDAGQPVAVGRYAGQARPVNAAVALPSPDSQPLFATGSGGRAKGGNELRVWRFEPSEKVEEETEGEPGEGEEGPAGKVRDLAVIGDFDGPVRSLAVSADGTLLAVGDDAGAVRLYRVADLTPEPPADAPPVEDAEEDEPEAEPTPAAEPEK